MKDNPEIGYYDEEGNFIEKKMPSNRVRCHWSNDNIECKFIAVNGNVFCEKHYNQVMKINGRDFKGNNIVKEA